MMRVALGQVVNGEDGAGHDPRVRDLLPFRSLICTKPIKSDQSESKQSQNANPRIQSWGMGGIGGRTSVVVASGGGEGPLGGGGGGRLLRRIDQRSETGSRHGRRHVSFASSSLTFRLFDSTNPFLNVRFNLKRERSGRKYGEPCLPRLYDWSTTLPFHFSPRIVL